MGRTISDKDYNEYISSNAWRLKADQRLEIDHHVCCVCGNRATEVHHLTYDHFRNEKTDELISLCRKCHEKAEEIYDPAITPWSYDGKINFMTAVIMDTQKISPIVFDHLIKMRGADFNSLMQLRQPTREDERAYWGVLKKAVDALCRKRYWFHCAEDRKEIILTAISNRTITMCVEKIEHDVRNYTQGQLHDAVMGTWEANETQKAAAAVLNISLGTFTKLRKDDGMASSSGPTMRETALFYCGLDTEAGIRPSKKISCLSDEDFKELNRHADYMAQQFTLQED